MLYVVSMTFDKLIRRDRASTIHAFVAGLLKHFHFLDTSARRPDIQFFNFSFENLIFTLVFRNIPRHFLTSFLVPLEFSRQLHAHFVDTTIFVYNSIDYVDGLVENLFYNGLPEISFLQRHKVML